MEKHMKEILLTVKEMHKSFGATKALRGIDLEIRNGEIHGLIGENGSGKSTASSIIAGIRPCDSGKMIFKGDEYIPKNIFEAEKKGIAMVGQEQNTLPDVSVAENIFTGKEERFISRLLVNTMKMKSEASKILDMLGIDKVDPGVNMRAYNFEQRKLVELARAMYDDPQLLIVDETPTALSEYGRNILYKCMYNMRNNDKAVLFISHDIDEIIEMCDRVTILRDGQIITTLEKADFDSHTMKQYMVGREIEENYYRTDDEGALTDDVALKVEGVYTDHLEDINLNVRFGEILGIGGLTDCGMHELGKIMFGLEKPLVGSVKAGSGAVVKDPQTALKLKMAYISKNRDSESLMLASTIWENICIPSLRKIQKGPFLTQKAQHRFAEEQAKVLSVKMSTVKENVSNLSGGNKQKVAVTKWLATDANIYIFDCPTRGIDVGVQSDIYDLLTDLKRRKKAIIMISEELPELIGMSDNIVILKDGKISAVVPRNKENSESSLISYII
ncbi:MAG: sugar ABC transporter ATP-binding protein, partial [Eubacterium sp.]|nr:sugar ABC transporter ATP-binding protein [Eubacterium sp.]